MKHYLLFTILLLTCNITFAQLTEPVYNVHDYGAIGDGETNDQAAIQLAIEKCGETGGTVLFKNGNFLTGQIVLVSNMTLFIDSSATILGIQSDSEEHYPHHLIETKYPNRMRDDCQRRLIYGNHVDNVIIDGSGTINGQGDFEPWMNVKELGTEKDRPSILAFVGCNHIQISNITLLKPACWTQVYIESNDIAIRNIKVNTGNLTPNRDGIDIVDCHNVLIDGCFIQSEDDGICFKSGSEYGCKDVNVRNCTIDKLNVNAGNCLKLGTDGLGSFKNFSVYGMILKNAAQNSAIVIESMDGAVIDNLKFASCRIENCGQAIFMLLADRGRTVPGRKSRIGSISNVHFVNMLGRNFTRQYPSIITGIEGHSIQNVTFVDLDFELKGGVDVNDQTVMEYDGKYPEGSKFGNTNAYAFYLRHVDGASFKNCIIKAKNEDAREWIVSERVENLILE